MVFSCVLCSLPSMILSLSMVLQHKLASWIPLYQYSVFNFFSQLILLFNFQKYFGSLIFVVFLLFDFLGFITFLWYSHFSGILIRNRNHVLNLSCLNHNPFYHFTFTRFFPLVLKHDYTKEDLTIIHRYWGFECLFSLSPLDQWEAESLG